MNNLSIKWLVLRKGVEKYLIKNFKIFVPSSSGDSKILGLHTKIAINTVFPLISKLLKILDFNLEIEKANTFCKKRKRISQSNLLKNKFNYYNSDKSSKHNYHYIYGSLFKNKEKIKKVLEIGLGTDDENIISNMGKNGKPGASLRAFKDYFNKASIYGADIDKKILFSENRIKTYFVDQTNDQSLRMLFKKIGNNFDLIVDDGLHAVHANINLLNVGLKYLKKDGWMVIEDIPYIAKPIWQVVGFILSHKFSCLLVEAKSSYLFLINKK